MVRVIDARKFAKHNRTFLLIGVVDANLIAGEYLRRLLLQQTCCWGLFAPFQSRFAHLWNLWFPCQELPSVWNNDVSSIGVERDTNVPAWLDWQHLGHDSDHHVFDCHQCLFPEYW